MFLPSGGATNLPTEFKSVATQGALLGYDTIVLAYRNEVGINAAPPAGCGPAEAPPASPPNCAYDVHRELLDGNNESSVITVDKANGDREPPHQAAPVPRAQRTPTSAGPTTSTAPRRSGRRS